MQDKVFDAQNQIILNLADKESCIIVGRCSNFILRHNKHHVSIYIYAPVEDRVKNCIESLGMDAVTARKMISKVDRARDSYNMMYTRRHPGDKADTDILINSSVLGVDGTAKMLATLVIEKFGSGSQKS